MPEEISALHHQLAAVSKDLGDRLDRIEGALLGDRSLGLTGMVDRVSRLDKESVDAAKVHEAIEDRRRQGDQRIHERLDKLEGKWRLAVGIAIGASISSAGGAAWIVQATQR